MKVISGNILDIKHGIIAHQVNMKGVMGAGLALQIKKTYPDAYYFYKFQFFEKTLELGMAQVVEINNHLSVANLVAQVSYGRDGKCYTDYDALAKCLKKLSLHKKMCLPHSSIYLPHGMGAGLAGGDWQIILKLIEDNCPSAILVKRSK